MSQKLTYLARLSDHRKRREAARDLASAVGARDLIVFVSDPDIQVLLPAVGFPQTLPRGMAWQTFLAACMAHGEARTRLPLGDSEVLWEACGIGADEAVVVLLGGHPLAEDLEEIRQLLPLLSAAFRGELVVNVANTRARLAQEAAAEASALAESLERLRRELATALRQRKRAEELLVQRAEQLAEADRRKDEFLAMLAHELRNPLAPVRNALQIMKMTGPSGDIFEQVRTMAERQIHHLTRLVDDLMDVARITRGQIQLQTRPVSLAAIILSAVEESRLLIESRRQELTVAAPPEHVRLDADATRLAQVLTNLLHNATKFTKETGKIWLTTELSSSHVVIRVRDNGQGMSAEMLPKIFDLFAQAERSLDRSQGGLGIGLTLVKRLVELHGGSIEAFSDGLGRGSEFVIRLPLLADEPRSPVASPLQNEDAGLPRHRILVVDDNVDSAQSLSMLLRLHGQEVQIAHDGWSAIQAAETFQPNLVLLDIGLPKMDGFEVARRMRQKSTFPLPFLVALTGYGQDEDRRRSRDAGFHLHLVKPVTPEQLRQLLEQPVDMRLGNEGVESPGEA